MNQMNKDAKNKEKSQINKRIREHQNEKRN